MPLGRAYSVAVAGVDGHMVEIEADIGRGLPGVHLVGLPDTALQESRDRVRAAVTNSHEKWPESRVILALSPATLPKVGSVYDLALAMSVLVAAGAVPQDSLEKTVLLGELALDGRVRTVRGVLPAVIAAKNAGWPRVVVPESSLAEAGLVDGVEVLGAQTLTGVIGWLRGSGTLAEPGGCIVEEVARGFDLSDVVGQEEARWAVEVAAAGAHHLLFTGPPGVGKTMLAQRIPGLLPPLTEEEALEVTAIHSVAGLLSDRHPLITVPPFVAPHHTTSITALVGGGSGMARPGAVSQAHRGVLFLDESVNTKARHRNLAILLLIGPPSRLTTRSNLRSTMSLFAQVNWPDANVAAERWSPLGTITMNSLKNELGISLRDLQELAAKAKVNKKSGSAKLYPAEADRIRSACLVKAAMDANRRRALEQGINVRTERKPSVAYGGQCRCCEHVVTRRDRLEDGFCVACVRHKNMSRLDIVSDHANASLAALQEANSEIRRLRNKVADLSEGVSPWREVGLRVFVGHFPSDNKRCDECKELWPCPTFKTIGEVSRGVLKEVEHAQTLCDEDFDAYALKAGRRQPLREPAVGE